MRARSTFLLSAVSALALACSASDTGDTESTSSSTTSASSGFMTAGVTTSTTGTGTSTDSAGTTTGMSSTTSASGTATATATDGMSSTTGPMNCGEVTVDPKVPQVMLVLDKSGSMWKNSWDPTGMGATPVTRWQSLYEVVELLGTQFGGSIAFGEVLFPNIDAATNTSVMPVDYAAACVVNGTPEVGLSIGNGAALLAAMPAKTTVDGDPGTKGGTPAALGVYNARTALNALTGDDPKYILLVTDGAANCGQDTPGGTFTACDPLGAGMYATDKCPLLETFDENLKAQVAAALGENIGTYVIGIDIQDVDPIDPMPTNVDGNPDVNTYDKLNEVASMGGHPKSDPSNPTELFYNSKSQTELEMALQQIAMDAISCTIPLSTIPSENQIPYGHVQLGAEIMPSNPFGADSAPYLKGTMGCGEFPGQDGWAYTSTNYDEIELCGNACTRLKSGEQFSLQFECIFQ